MATSEAARFAKYSSANARGQGWHLLRRPEIIARIAEMEGEREAEDVGASALQTLVDADTSHLEHTSAEWVIAKLGRAYLVAEARNDLTAMPKILVELGKIRGLYVERSEVTHKSDALAALTGPELLQLRSFLAKRLAAASKPVIDQPVIVVDAQRTLSAPLSDAQLDGTAGSRP